MELSRALDRILHLQHHLKPDANAIPAELLEPSPSQALTQSGWLPNKRGQPVVIGGMVMDVQGMTAKEQTLQRGTTTPGKVFFTHGGVARNVAECMACLGAPPFLISVLGRDPPGEAMFAHWQALGLPLEGILRKPGIATPIVSAILDTGGEIAASIDDITAIEEHLTPDWITRFEDVIAAAPIVVLDANLLPDAIWTACQIAAKHGVPTWFEPVSVSKSTRATRALSLVTFVSPSEEEVASMAAAASGAAFEGSKASGQYRASEAFAESKPLEAPQTSRTSVAFGASEASATPSTAASLPPIRPSDMSEVVEASAAASKPDPRSFRGASDASESSRAFAGVSDGASSSFFGAGASEPPRASEKPRDVSLHGKICCCASSRRSGDAASEGDGLRREKQAHCNCGKVGQEAATCRSHLQPVSSGPSSGKHGGPEREGRAQGDVSDEVDRFGRFRTGSTVAFASGDSGNGLSCREGSRESRGESVADLIRQYEPDVRKILDAGVRYVVLTLGARGVCVSRFATQEEGYTSGGDGIERSGRLLATSSGTGDSSTLFSQPRRFPSHLMPLSIQPQAPAQRAVDAPSSSLRGIVHHHVPALPARVVGLTGAGDSVVAGTVAGLVTGQAANPVEAAAFGVAAARLTVQSARNVPEGLSVEAIRGDADVALKSIVRVS